MWGIAFCIDPRYWRLGAVDAVDEDPTTGRPVIIGRWYCFGPVAITYDYE